MTLTSRGETVVVTLVLMVTVVFLTGCAIIGQNLKQHRLDSGLIPPISCQEDMACWDCTTMGNKECGP